MIDDAHRHGQDQRSAADQSNRLEAMTERDPRPRAEQLIESFWRRGTCCRGETGGRVAPATGEGGLMAERSGDYQLATRARREDRRVRRPA